jgi:hypothetical protein
VKLSGEVRKGQLVIPPASLAIALREYDGQRVTVEIEREKSIRSLRANARYWSVLIPLAQDFLSKTRDVPLSKDQCHYVLVAAFAGCDETPLGLVPVRTSSMTTAQFATYCETVQVWLAENGYYVPDGGLTESPA